MPDIESAEKCFDDIATAIDAIMESGHLSRRTIEMIVDRCKDGKDALHRRIKRG